MNFEHSDLEQKVQKTLDRHEIENLMGKHAYYHAVYDNVKELEELWVKKAPDPVFAQNQGYYVGYEIINRYYGEICEEMKTRNLKTMSRLFPEQVKDLPEYRGVGTLLMHTLTTPVIEIAGDGQTAKGVWYSPGQVTEVGPKGPSAAWIWEKYAVDFLKEDVQWKIWHMHVYTDFFTPLSKSWTDVTGDAPMGASTEEASSGELVLPDWMPRPNIPVVTYKVYSPTLVPQFEPRMPVPYYTFSETFSYGPSKEDMEKYLEKDCCRKK